MRTMRQWRLAVARAIQRKSGQAFLKEMKAALEALPEKKLLMENLQDEYEDGAVSALGAIGRLRNLKMSNIDPEDYEQIAALFKVPHSLVCEVMYMNYDHWWRLSPKARYKKVIGWLESQIK